MKSKKLLQGKIEKDASLSNYSQPCRGFHFWRGSGPRLCCRLADSGRCEGSRLSIRQAAFQGAALTLVSPGPNPGFVTYKQYNLDKGYLMPPKLSFPADKMEEHSTCLVEFL